jgi:hypothetical protein
MDHHLVKETYIDLIYIEIIQTNYSSTQQVELTVLIYLLQKITDKPLNIVSDSAYVVGQFPAIETALISTTHKVIKTL